MGKNKLPKVETLQDLLTRRWTFAVGGAVFPDSYGLRRSAAAVAKLVREDRGAMGVIGFCAAMARVRS